MSDLLHSPHIPSTGELHGKFADEQDTELDSLADKLGSYYIAGGQLGLRELPTGTTELPRATTDKNEGYARTPSGHVRFTEPGAADNNLTQGFGMTERLTPEQIAINNAGLKLVRGALAAARAKASAETEPKPENEQPTLF